jgi:hypothetical protein
MFIPPASHTAIPSSSSAFVPSVPDDFAPLYPLCAAALMRAYLLPPTCASWYGFVPPYAVSPPDPVAS